VVGVFTIWIVGGMLARALGSARVTAAMMERLEGLEDFKQ